MKKKVEIYNLNGKICMENSGYIWGDCTARISFDREEALEIAQNLINFSKNDLNFKE